MSHDGLAGAVVTKDGDLVSVFKHPDSKEDIMPLLTEAAAHAKTLDAFDLHGYLPDLYGKLGFKPVARVTFNPAQAPAKWDSDKLDSPDVVMMVKSNDKNLPDVSKGYNLSKDNVSVMDYDKARELQSSYADRIDVDTKKKSEKIN